MTRFDSNFCWCRSWRAQLISLRWDSTIRFNLWILLRSQSAWNSFLNLSVPLSARIFFKSFKENPDLLIVWGRAKFTEDEQSSCWCSTFRRQGSCFVICEWYAFRCDPGRMYKSKLQDSVQLQTVLALYDQQTVDDENSKLQSPERCCGKMISHQESKRNESQRWEEVFSVESTWTMFQRRHAVSVMTNSLWQKSFFLRLKTSTTKSPDATPHAGRPHTSRETEIPHHFVSRRSINDTANDTAAVRMPSHCQEKAALTHRKLAACLCQSVTKCLLCAGAPAIPTRCVRPGNQITLRKEVRSCANGKIVKARHVNLGIFPCQNYKSDKGCVFGNKCHSDMLRQEGIRSQFRSTDAHDVSKLQNPDACFFGDKYHFEIEVEEDVQKVNNETISEKISSSWTKRTGSKHAVKFSTRPNKISGMGPLRRIVQKCAPHERSPCVPWLGERSHKKTLHQERFVRTRECRQNYVLCSSVCKLPSNFGSRQGIVVSFASLLRRIFLMVCKGWSARMAQCCAWTASHQFNGHVSSHGGPSGLSSATQSHRGQGGFPVEAQVATTTFWNPDGRELWQFWEEGDSAEICGLHACLHWR